MGDALTLDATIVLDLMRRGTEEEDEARQTVDRTYWDGRASRLAMSLVDQLLVLVREATGDEQLALKYNKHYIA